MKSSIDIIDAVGRKLGHASDAEIAKATGILPSTISTVRAGRRSLPPVDCKKAALILGVEPSALFLIAAGERQKDRTLKASCFRLARTALPLVAALGICAAPAPPARAAAAPQAGDCLLCKIPRRRRPSGKTPVYTGTYPTPPRVKRPTLHLRDAPIPSIPTTTT